MLLSMTGFGRATGACGDKTITVEVRALNSKVTDLKLKLPGDYKEKELELRRLVTEHAERGKIDLVLDVQNADGAANVNINEALFKGYHRELTRLGKELNMHTPDLMQVILRIPNVISMPSADMDEDLWQNITQTISLALDHLRSFRQQEGKVLEQELLDRSDNILQLLYSVQEFETERINRMRERLRNNSEEFLSRDNHDANRFEQEMLYYLEKLDITEEKVRLEQHCRYFHEQIKNDTNATGRTLNFISQEMGREINTLGAKAYDASIQKIVVHMKDELEKIKEQLANVL